MQLVVLNFLPMVLWSGIVRLVARVRQKANRQTDRQTDRQTEPSSDPRRSGRAGGGGGGGFPSPWPRHNPFESARTACDPRGHHLVGARHALWRVERAREAGRAKRVRKGGRRGWNSRAPARHRPPPPKKGTRYTQRFNWFVNPHPKTLRDYRSKPTIIQLVNYIRT
jgi:hypothetical protein